MGDGSGRRPVLNSIEFPLNRPSITHHLVRSDVCYSRSIDITYKLVISVYMCHVCVPLSCPHAIYVNTRSCVYVRQVFTALAPLSLDETGGGADSTGTGTSHAVQMVSYMQIR